MDEKRTAFEAYITGKQFGLPPKAIQRDPETGEYENSQTQDFWLVWRAASGSGHSWQAPAPLSEERPASTTELGHPAKTQKTGRT